MAASLIIAGVELSIASMLDFDQQIGVVSGGSTMRRLANGSAFTMRRWRKSAISLSGSGEVPAALVGIDLSGQFEVQLPIPIALRVGESLPAGFSARADNPEVLISDCAENSQRHVWVKFTAVCPAGAVTSSSYSRDNSWQLVLEQA